MHAKLLTFYLIIYLSACFLVPSFLIWRRHGVWPMVFNRTGNRMQVFLGIFFKAALLGIVAFSTIAGFFPAMLENAVVMSEVTHTLVDGFSTLLGIHIADASLHLLTIYIGWGLLLFGGAVCVIAQKQMGASWRIGIDDRKTALVTHGIYQYSRNPIFAGLLILLVGYAMILPSLWSIVIFFLVFGAIRYQIAKEEAHLLRLHQDDYHNYAHKVGRFVPGWGRL